MSRDIDKFSQLINQSAIVKQVLGDYGKKMVTLAESREVDSKVCVDGIPDDTIVFNLDDNYDPPERIFAGARGECCRSDFIFITDHDGCKVIVCAELKKGSDDLKHIKDQLRGATAFVGYCKNILKQFWSYDFKLHEYEFHYVAFQNTARKRGTRINARDDAVNTSVDSVLKLEGGIVFRYNKIIQKHL